jgi:protein gp37
MVFVCDTSDMFHDAFMTRENMHHIYDAMFSMWHEKRVTWQILTKRPEQAKTFFETYQHIGEFVDPAPHVWLGVSVENQQTADERIPILLSIPNVRHFMSIEPMLGPINIWEYLDHVNEYHPSQLEWVIVGGESGAQHRPMKEEWAQEIGEECYWANVPFFYKQDSARFPGTCESRLCGCREWPE